MIIPHLFRMIIPDAIRMTPAANKKKPDGSSLAISMPEPRHNMAKPYFLHFHITNAPLRKVSSDTLYAKGLVQIYNLLIGLFHVL